MSTTAHPQFTAKDEGPHPFTDSPIWQESVLLHWYDQRQGIGGWHRIGHEPNNRGGHAALWSFLFDKAGWQYRRCGEVQLSAADTFTHGFGAGSALRFAYENDAAVWTVNDGPVSARVECRNLFPLVDPFPPGDEVAAKRFPNHFEVAGRVTGEVSYEGRKTTVAGFGYRDHSWGQRDWERGMLNHRWFTGTLGTELSFAAITAQANTGRLVRTGYIRRNGETIFAQEVDVIAYMEPDGLTHRGGEIRMTLPGGERIEIHCTARAGVAFQRGTVVMVEIMCAAEGHGLQGYCDAEISTNPRNGTGPVLLTLNANFTDGVTPFELLDFRR
ncbi:MAG TPA: hypothetical protein VJS42_14480 [Steroidobacteraceae bacterium]|nr:hypothetical protein [Steroidobacteraceae bacterium]